MGMGINNIGWMDRMESAGRQHGGGIWVVENARVTQSQAKVGHRIDICVSHHSSCYASACS